MLSPEVLEMFYNAIFKWARSSGFTLKKSHNIAQHWVNNISNTPL